MSRIVRFIRSAVIDILLLISVSLAAGHYQKGVAAMTKPVICGIGPAVLDGRLLVDPSVFLEGRKLSDSQLADAETAAQLSRLATWTIVTEKNPLITWKFPDFGQRLRLSKGQKSCFLEKIFALLRLRNVLLMSQFLETERPLRLHAGGPEVWKS